MEMFRRRLPPIQVRTGTLSAVAIDGAFEPSTRVKPTAMREALRRLADTAEALERQAGELRAQVAELAEAVRERAEAEARRAADSERPLEPAVEPAEAADDSEARLVAYSMVLDGRPRDEVAGHLADEFGMTDADALLDDLYARAGA
jgi:septal ring factor EnvC (AmiA/AmiB activator)